MLRQSIDRLLDPNVAPPLKELLLNVAAAAGAPADEAEAVYQALSRDDVRTLRQLEQFDDRQWAALPAYAPFKTALREAVLNSAKEGSKFMRRRVR